MYRRVREPQGDKDWTQSRIAAYLNCSQRAYSNYERGEVDIPTHILRKLTILHESSIDYLPELTDEPRPYARKAASQEE